MEKKIHTYKDAGVDINAGDESVRLIAPHVRETFRREVLTDIGGFGALFAPDWQKYREPVLVSATDGAGTKLKIAFLLDKHDTIGQDVVAMCVNDLLVAGAEPLFFLDYLATGKIHPTKVAEIVAGVATGCKLAGCALVGGETAEMPGFYQEGEYDLAGFSVGMVERSKVVDGSNIIPGDLVVGIPSSGLHSNGYSLARKIFLDTLGWKTDKYVPEFKRTLGEELLEPTRIYVSLIHSLLLEVNIKGMAHITGGGLLGNLVRILPNNVDVEISKKDIPVQPVFQLLQELGNVPEEEMYRTFNMGTGYVVVISASDLDLFRTVMIRLGEKFHLLGEIYKKH